MEIDNESKRAISFNQKSGFGKLSEDKLEFLDKTIAPIVYFTLVITLLEGPH